MVWLAEETGAVSAVDTSTGEQLWLNEDAAAVTAPVESLHHERVVFGAKGRWAPAQAQDMPSRSKQVSGARQRR